MFAHLFGIECWWILFCDRMLKILFGIDKYIAYISRWVSSAWDESAVPFSCHMFVIDVLCVVYRLIE